MSNSVPSASAGPSNRHVLSAVERQRSQLEKLLKDPAKPAYIPPPPKEKTIRPAREMMKNVQGSSAGAGSGEFHVYKASRRREYERLKLLEEASQQEAEAAEFERRRRETEEAANAKTAKNRAKRLKKRDRAKTKGGRGDSEFTTIRTLGEDIPIKKRRLANDGDELVFRKPGEESDSESEEVEPISSSGQNPEEARLISKDETKATSEPSRITIVEDD